MRTLPWLILIVVCLACKKNDTERLGLPVIYRFYQDADTIGATLTILGGNFSQHPSNNIIGFKGAQTSSYYSKDDTLRVIVPKNATSGPIVLTVYSNTTTSIDTFFVVTGSFRSMSPIPNGRYTAVAFTIGEKGYIGTGTGNGYLNDFWEYNPTSNSWNQKSDFIGGQRREGFSFTINEKGYIGAGFNTTTFSAANDFYEYNPANDQWTQKVNMPVPAAYTDGGLGLVINNKGYFFCGSWYNEVLEYDPINDQWNKKSDFPGLNRYAPSGFVINNKGYVGIGWPGGNSNYLTFLNDFWEYDPSLDKWTQKASVPYHLGSNAVSFTINNKGYFANGNENRRIVLEYDPINDTWTRKSNFPGISNGYAASFVINNKAYIIGGTMLNNYSSENWCFTP